jgi:ABC-type oligopeptide transport system substrate-binding subunit
VRFEPGVRLELARNEMYWRPGYPKSGGLVFSFGVQARQILADFRSGRFSIASDLLPEDAEALRRDPRFAAGRREAPQLSTYFAIFNTRAGPFRDRALRERFVRAVNVSSLVRATLGRSASPAHGLIPPGLVGHQPDRASDWSASQNASLAGTEVEVTAAFSPVFMGGCEPLARELIVQLQRAGIRVRRVTETTAEYHEASQRATVDLVLGRWVGDFPDADTFVHGVLHSEEGFFGRLCGTPEIDRLVKQGRTETDPAVRHAIYGQIEQTIAKDALLLPLFHEQAYRFARPEVEGLTVTYWVPTVRYEELRVRSGGT